MSDLDQSLLELNFDNQQNKFFDKKVLAMATSIGFFAFSVKPHLLAQKYT